MDKDTANVGKCPFTHGGATSSKTSGTTNRDWWPNQLQLNILHQHDRKSNLWEKILTIMKNFKSWTMTH